MLVHLSGMTAYTIIIFLWHSYIEKEFVLFLNAYFEWLEWDLTKFSVKVSSQIMTGTQKTLQKKLHSLCLSDTCKIWSGQVNNL
jgi:hypothetical protein